MDKQSLQKKTLKELKELAKEHSVAIGSLKKDELVNSLLEKIPDSESDYSDDEPESKKPVSESKKSVVSESKKSVASESKKPVASESKKPVVSESKKSVASESKKTVVSESRKSVEPEPESKIVSQVRLVKMMSKPKQAPPLKSSPKGPSSRPKGPPNKPKVASRVIKPPTPRKIPANQLTVPVLPPKPRVPVDKSVYEKNMSPEKLKKVDIEIKCNRLLFTCKQ